MKKSILILSALLSFLIGAVSTASAQTFDFNTGTTQNWTLDQMYETSTQKKITPFTSFALSNQGNQLAASASPILIGNASVMSYDIYLQSPDLSSNSQWQSITGYSIDLKRTLGSPCGNPPNVYFAQLQMKVIDTSDGNKEKLFAEYNGTSFVFHTIKINQQYHFVWKPSFLSNPKYKVKYIRIRLTGPGDPSAGECAPKGSWLLDNVSATSGTAASLIVDVPNGGEVWEAATPRYIRWHSPNFTKPVKIEYSVNGGTSYSTIIASTTNNGSYKWTVPNTPSTKCRVRISDAASGTPSDVSNANFTIAASEAIFLDVPNGGESWEAATPRYIVWHNHLFNGAVKIEYSTDGGSNYTTITASTANTGSYQWTVPNTPSVQCRVRISDAADGNPSDVSDANFTITANESITLDVPNGGENWNVGSPRIVVWHNHLFNGAVKIEYSTDGGTSYSTIVASTPNSGSYTWTIPNTPSANCLVKVSDAADGNPWDVSDKTFTISALAGNNTPAGSNIQIVLGSGVELSFDNVTGSGNTTLKAKTSGPPPPGGFTVVPLSAPIYYEISTTATFTGNIQICVQYNAAGMTPAQIAALNFQVYENPPGQWNDITVSHDVNNNIICGSVNHLSEFAVLVPGAAESITVTSPNGGESWLVGSEQEITWTSANFTAPVRIEYSIDGNASHLEVVSSTENDGSYLWTIPNTPSTNCVVIISDATDAQPFDISDAVFTISTTASSTITVMTPNGGENLQVGSEYWIEWSSNFADPVRIEYSTDGGASFSTVIASTENDGAYQWTVPNTASTNCRVKISDAADGDPFDVSDADFTITAGVIGGVLLVTNTNDSEPGSLRDAILQANAHVGMDTIFFAIPRGVPGYDPDTGVWTIQPASKLPDITDPGLLIDGNSQAKFIGEDANPNGPEILLDGSNAGASSVGGLNIYTEVIEICGLTINRFSGAGIYMDGAEVVRISGCYIGTNFAGTDSAGNETGLWLRKGTKGVYIGPTDSLKAGNVISGNKVSGVLIADSSSHNIVVGNYIGLNRMGTGTVGNQYGISIWSQSDSNQVFDNRISGNSIGVSILEANDNVIANNFIGSDEAWQLESGNLDDGVNITGSIKAQGNIIEENLIGYNGQNGIEVLGAQAIHNPIRRNRLSRNVGLGIDNVNGGNTELTPPVIVTATTAQITGTAGAGQIVEIFADENDEGLIYLGSTTADASGNFVLTLSNPLPPLPYVTATATDAAGNTSEFSSPFVTAVEEALEAQVPKEFSLSQNYPNPFNPETVIRYTLPKNSHVLIQIVNIMGEHVKTLIDKEMNAGKYSVKWNGTNNNGRRVASGVYLYRLEAGSFADVKKMILLQ